MNIHQNKYEARTQKKKEAIIQAALFYFHERGFKETSIKDIAAKAQVSQVSIYNYFGCKDTLVAECARIILKETLDEALQLLDTDIPYLNKLNQALSLCTGNVNASLTEYFSASALSDRNFMKLLSEGIIELQQNVYIAYIEAGKKEGYINPSFPTATILKYLTAFQSIELSPDHYSTEVQVLHHLFLNGILIK